MPHLVRTYSPQHVLDPRGQPVVVSARDGIQQTGPLVQVSLSVTTEIADELISSHSPIPTPVVGWALIDTGASHTGIDEGVVARLRLPLIDRIRVATPSTDGSECTRHPLSVEVLGSEWRFDVIGTSHRLAGQNLVMLIGRDVMRNVHFTYHGEFGFFTVSL